jgi:hypothetical protein
VSENDRPQVSFGSGAWWSSRSDDELRESVRGNYPGGLAHDGAMAELERRAAANERRSQLFWIKATFWTALALGIAGLLATALTG